MRFGDSKVNLFGAWYPRSLFEQSGRSWPLPPGVITAEPSAEWGWVLWTQDSQMAAPPDLVAALDALAAETGLAGDLATLAAASRPPPPRYEPSPVEIEARALLRRAAPLTAAEREAARAELIAEKGQP